MAGSNEQPAHLTNWINIPAVLVAGAELSVFFPSSGRNHRQYSLHIPMEGWPGWVGLGGWLPHPSYVATLPDNTLATEWHVVFLRVGWLWRHHRWCDQQTTDEFLEISRTDWYVCGTPSWLTTKSNKIHILRCSCSLWSVIHWMPINCTMSLSFFGSLRRLRSFQILLVNSFSNFCAVYPLGRDKF